jgi:hypothetical protein
MAQQTIGVGTVANDNTGDPIRDAFVKVNANFDEIYATGMTDGDLRVVTDGTNLTQIGVDGAITNSDITLTPNGTGQVVFETDRWRLTTTHTPGTSKGVSGDTAGDFAYDGTYLYVCTVTWTDGVADIWHRISIAPTTW